MSFEDGMAAANFVQKGKQLQSREDRVESFVQGFVGSSVGVEKGRCHKDCRIRRVVQEADRCDEFWRWHGGGQVCLEKQAVAAQLGNYSEMKIFAKHYYFDMGNN